MRKGWKKAVSTMLCAAMILSMSSFMVSADGETTIPETPAGDATTEVPGDEKDPEEQPPVNEEKDPADEEKDPADEEKDPADEGKDPADEEKDPADEEKDPADEEKDPADEEKDPADEEKDPSEVPGGPEQPSNSLPLTPLTPATPPAENEIMTLEETAEETVCTVGEKPYSSLRNAIENANEETITLTKDVTEDVEIPNGKTLTINLGTHKITNQSDHTITVKSGANLTITGNGTVDNVTHARAAIWNEGIVTLNGGAYTRSGEAGASEGESGGNSYYNIVNHGNMTINPGVSVSQTGHFSSLIENGWYNGNQNTSKTDSKMVINGGTFSGGLNTIKNDDYGDLTINGGNFTNTTQASLLNWNKATITGGTFESNASDAVILNGYINDTMDQGILNISGGTFTATGNGDAIQDMGGASQGGEITITSGNFTGDLNFNGNGSKTVQISGATINGDVKAATTATVELKDSTVTGDITGDNVTVDNTTSQNIVATVDGKGYTSLIDALNAAVSATPKTVTLQKNVELDSMLNITQEGVTLDLNGKTITSSENFDNKNQNTSHVINVAADNVTVKNGTIKATNKNRNTLQAYQANGVVFEKLVVDHSAAGAGAPIIINGSTVTMNGNNTLVLNPLSWYGINIDPNGQSAASLDFGKGSLTVQNNTTGVPIIKEDGDAAELEKITISGLDNVGLEERENGEYYQKPVPTPNPDEDDDDTTPSRPSGSHSTGSSSNSNVSYTRDPEQDKREAEENMWKRAINKINSARDGSSLKIYTGIVDEIPDYVLDALRENNVTVTFYNQNGDEVTIPAGMAPKSLRDSWTYKQLGNYVLSLDEVVTEVEETTETTQPAAEQNAEQNAQAADNTAKPNPETGDASSSMMAIAAAAASLCGVVLLSKKNK